MILFPIIILNEELGALAQGMLVPVHRAMSRFRRTSQSRVLVSCFDQVLGGLGDSRIHQVCWGGDKEAEGRAQGSLLLKPSSPGFYLREAKTSQKLPHCVQDSPAPRRQRVTLQRSLAPMAASGTQGCSWAEWSKY